MAPFLLVPAESSWIDRLVKTVLNSDPYKVPFKADLEDLSRIDWENLHSHCPCCTYFVDKEKACVSLLSIWHFSKSPDSFWEKISFSIAKCSATYELLKAYS